MLAVTVKGGTNAGRRITREAPSAWSHVCHGNPPEPTTLAGYWVRCPVCKEKRP